MVKTPHGRKPGARHAKIVKKLRHRRRMNALQQAAHQDQETVECSEVSCEILERQPELPNRRLYFLLSESNLLSFDDDEPADDKKESIEAVKVEDKNKQVVPFKARNFLVRGASETSVGYGARNVDRPSVSESNLHQNAIPMPAPKRIQDDDASTAHSGYFEGEDDSDDEESLSELSEDKDQKETQQQQHLSTEDEEKTLQAGTVDEKTLRHPHDDHDRIQHPDEHTDHYLSHLHAPSIANITTAWDDHTTHMDTRTHHDAHHNDVDTKSDDYQRLRNLFSSDTQHTKPATEADTTTDEFQRLRNLFSSDSQHTKPVTSETTLGLNTLFNNRTARNVSSHDTSLGLRTFFDEKTGQHHDSFRPGLPTILSETSLGLNTLFNIKSIANTTSYDTSMGLRTLFDEISHRHLSEHDTHTQNDRTHNDADTHTDDLHRLPSLFESLFDKYRKAVAEVERLKNEIAEMKKVQNE